MNRIPLVGGVRSGIFLWDQRGLMMTQFSEYMTPWLQRDFICGAVCGKMSTQNSVHVKIKWQPWYTYCESYFVAIGVRVFCTHEFIESRKLRFVNLNFIVVWSIVIGLVEHLFARVVAAITQCHRWWCRYLSLLLVATVTCKVHDIWQQGKAKYWSCTPWDVAASHDVPSGIRYIEEPCEGMRIRLNREIGTS